MTENNNDNINADADADADADAVWNAAERYAEAQPHPQDKEALSNAVKTLSGLGSEVSVYVAKLTQEGLYNQVWQGKSLSEYNDLMVFLDQTTNPNNVVEAVRGRLSPRSDSGFEAVVIGKQDPHGGWDVHEVVEYDNSGVGERLGRLIGRQLSVVKVSDPAAVAHALGKSSLRESAQEQRAASLALSESEYEPSADDVMNHLYEAKNVVLDGPPGTGKTRLALQVADAFCKGDAGPFRLESLLDGNAIDDRVNELREAPVVWEIVQLHPAFGYDEFVRGLRTDPEALGFTLRSVDGILPQMARVAMLREGRPTLLIVDEINRGNLSAILGETIFAIDPAHRGREVRLQYEAPAGGDDALKVPHNLYLLATMNTADRSIAMLDFAVRRRFRFLHLAPSVAALDAFYADHPRRAEQAGTLFRLFTTAIREPELQPGHSYFMVSGHATLDDRMWAERLTSRIMHDVRPLFDEYREEGITMSPVKLDQSLGAPDLANSTADVVRDVLLQWLAPAEGNQ